MIEKMLQIDPKGDTLTGALGLDEEKMMKETSELAKEMIRHPKVTDAMQFIWSNNDLTLEEQVFLTYTMGKLSSDPMMAARVALGVKCNCEDCRKKKGE